MEMFWPSLAFGLIVVSFFLFSVLDGFDLGIGMIVVFLRDRNEAGKLLDKIAPFWDGNELWLIIGVGLVFAFFPSAFAVLFSTLYLPIMAIIVAFILRAVAIEFSYHNQDQAKKWSGLLSAGSFFATFIGLYAIGMIVSGLPLDRQGIASARFFDYLSWFPFILGCAGTLAVVWHGLTFALLKERSQPLEKIARRLWIPAAILSIIAIAFWSRSTPISSPLPVMMGGLIYCMGLVIGRVLLNKGTWAFRASCLSIVGAWVSICSTLFPAIIPVKNHPEWNLLLPKTAAPLSSLRPLVIVAILMIPVILIYSRIIYRIFQNPSREKRF